MERGSRLVCALAALLLFLPPVSEGSRAGDLPDLSVSPEGIAFIVNGEKANLSIAGLPVMLSITVRNAGPGSSEGGFVLITIDGSPAANLSLNTTLSPSAPLNVTTVEWLWNGTAPAGSHTVRVEVNDTAGDADPSNNAAVVVFRTITEPVVKVYLDRALAEAEVSESAQGNVRLTGCVNVKSEEGVRLMIQMTASTDTGWPASVSPLEAVFDSSGTRAFEALVVVPQATPASIIGTLTLQARGRGDGFVTGVASQTAKIIVRPYFRVGMEASPPHSEAAPGGEAEFYLKIWNQGNSVDSFDLAVENLRELVRDGWLVMLSSQGAYHVAPGECGTVKVTVRAPERSSLYTDETAIIRLHVTSQGAAARNESVSASDIVYVHERGYNQPAVAFLALAVVLVLALAVGYILVWWRRRGEER
ncbi:MAG: choice-of-anchor T family protein [Thermoplasmata archaeon]